MIPWWWVFPSAMAGGLISLLFIALCGANKDP